MIILPNLHDKASCKHKVQGVHMQGCKSQTYCMMEFGIMC